MLAQVVGHGNRVGYVATILCSTKEIEALIESGATEPREKYFGDDLERARRFCDRWNRRYGNGLS